MTEEWDDEVPTTVKITAREVHEADPSAQIGKTIAEIAREEGIKNYRLQDQDGNPILTSASMSTFADEDIRAVTMEIVGKGGL